MKGIEVTIRSIGNSQGIVIPKPILRQIGLEGETKAELIVDNGELVLRRLAPARREGWAESARAIAAREEDTLVLGDFGLQSDAEWEW